MGPGRRGVLQKYSQKMRATWRCTVKRVKRKWLIGLRAATAKKNLKQFDHVIFTPVFCEP